MYKIFYKNRESIRDATAEVQVLRPRGVIPHPLHEVNVLTVEIPTPKPYIFMIRVTRQIKCLIARVPGVIPHPLPEVNFLMVEIPTLKPYIYSLFSYLFIKQNQIHVYKLYV
jgi:hypothetical protein